MKTLLLLRHAKAEHGQTKFDDIDRALAPCGLESTPRLGSWMAENGYFPAVALVSTARRAAQTWDLVAPAIGTQTDVRHERALYLAPPGELLARLAAIGNEMESVIIVAHNPGLEVLAQLLTGPGSNSGAAADMARGFPTAGLAVFESDADSWDDIAGDSARLAAFVRPRAL